MPKGRTERVQQTLSRIMEIAEERQPVSVRGVAYALLTDGLIPDMHKRETNRVGGLVRELRESGTMPWSWIVDETRTVQHHGGGFDNPVEYLQAKLVNLYRRDYWSDQPYRVEVWSEKATVGGVLEPVLSKWYVSFRNLRGYTSATNAHYLASISAYGDAPLVAYT